jgi:sporulation protein YunB
MARRGKGRKLKRFKMFIAIISALIIGLFLFFQRNVTKVLISISEATIRSITTVAVNDAIYYTLNDSLRYEDLINIKYDEDGNVSAITTNALKINRIARDTAYLSQENLNRMSAEGIMVPIGALTGIEALAGFGKKINIKIIPISNVECKFVSKFVDAGINQTKHSLYLEIVSDISIILPSKSTNLASTIEVLICESVITGKIPDMYLQSSLLSSLLSSGNPLVP